MLELLQSAVNKCEPPGSELPDITTNIMFLIYNTQYHNTQTQNGQDRISSMFSLNGAEGKILSH